MKPAQPSDDLGTVLRDLVHQHEELNHEVIDKSLNLKGTGGWFGSATPIQVAVFDFLWFSDHQGHPGFVQSLTSAEIITRLAFGHELPAEVTVPGSIEYLARRLESILVGTYWSLSAREAVTDLGQAVLRRIDTERIQLDFDIRQRRAKKRLVELASDDPEIEAVETDLSETFPAFKRRLLEAVKERYKKASLDGAGWGGYLEAEVTRLSNKAMFLLGMNEHSSQGLVSCPWCGFGKLGLDPDDPDLVRCQYCRRNWRLSDGTATVHFTAWRNAGWMPDA